jgi:hypothetical protein
VLQLVEIAARRIAAGRLRAPDHRPGLFVEFANHPSVETKTSQPALDVAALAAIEPDLVLGHLIGFLRERRRVDGCEIAREVFVLVLCSAVLKGRDPGQRQRAELSIRITGQIGIQLFRLVGVSDGTPELELDFVVARSGKARRGRIGRAGPAFAFGASAGLR